MNRKKRGAPFKYTHGLMHAIATLCSAFQLDLRTCAGMASVFLGQNRDHPHYLQISGWINALELSIKKGLSELSCQTQSVTLIPDGTGLTPANAQRVYSRGAQAKTRLSQVGNYDKPGYDGDHRIQSD